MGYVYNIKLARFTQTGQLWFNELGPMLWGRTCECWYHMGLMRFSCNTILMGDPLIWLPCVNPCHNSLHILNGVNLYSWVERDRSKLIGNKRTADCHDTWCLHAFKAPLHFTRLPCQSTNCPCGQKTNEAFPFTGGHQWPRLTNEGKRGRELQIMWACDCEWGRRFMESRAHSYLGLC